MANLGALAVFLTADTTRFKKGMKTAKASVVAFKAAAVAALALATRAVARFSAEAVEAHKVQEKAERKLQGVLKATQHAAGLTADELRNYAAQMQRDMGIADEEVISHMAILATFRNVQGETFKQAIRLTEDLATVMGTEARSAAIQLGKALNDPVKGLDGLSRAGIQFTQEQKDQIKEMVKFNDTAGAQAKILEELERQFGGTAKAIANTDVGKLEQISMAIGDMKESAGALVLTVSPLTFTQRLAEGAKAFFDELKNVHDLWFNFNEVSKQAVDNVGAVVKEAGHLRTEVESIQKLASGPSELDKQVESAIVLSAKLREIRKENTLIGATEEEIAKDLRNQIGILDFQIKAYQNRELSQAKHNELLEKQIQRERLVGQLKQTQLGIDKAAAAAAEKEEKAKEKLRLQQQQLTPQLAGAFTEGSAQAFSVVAQAQARENAEYQQASLDALEAIRDASEETVRAMMSAMGFNQFGITTGA